MRIELQPCGDIMPKNDSNVLLGARMTRWVGVPLVALCLAAIGCSASTKPARGPTETLRAYAEALDQGRVDDAYAMLSDEAKRELSLDAFRRMVRENPSEMKEIAGALKRPANSPVVTATIATPDGDSLLLRYESGRWRVDASAIELYSQATPRQAVTSFIRAFERKRYDVLMRFVPDAKTPGLDAKKLQEAWEGSQKQEMQRLVPAVRSALPTATFEEVGDRATMPFGAVGTVELVREHGMWKIEDFN